MTGAARALRNARRRRMALKKARTPRVSHMRTVAISSGKGGVGKTNIAVNLALALSQRGKRVLLFDADLGLANVDIVLGLQCHKTLHDVIAGRERVTDVLVHVNDRFQVLPAGSGILQLERLSPAQRVELGRQLAELRELYDVLLIDTAAGMTENVLFFTRFADDVILVATPEPTAITDTYAMVKVLRSRHDVSSIALLVNQVATASQGAEVHQALNRVLRQFFGYELAYAGFLFRDGALQHAVRERRPVIVSRPQSLISGSFRTLAARFDQVFRGPLRSRDDDLWHALSRENLRPVDPIKLPLA